MTCVCVCVCVLLRAHKKPALDVGNKNPSPDEWGNKNPTYDVGNKHLT